MSKHLHDEIERLKRKVLHLSAIVQKNVALAIRSLKLRDMELAKEILEKDEQVDTLEVEVEEECLKILALHQPVAIDLRYVVAILKINNDLERVGDLAVNIAERALYLSKKDPVEAPFDFEKMEEKTQAMLKKSIECLILSDTQMANEVCVEDEEVDTINREAYKTITERLKTQPEVSKILLHYLSISRHLERIADYATNIAEDVIYTVDGKIVRHNPEMFLGE